MKKLAKMSVIQIDVTNACRLRCSNCTRFCGHHQKSFFIDYDFFTKAVDSLEGFRGMVGIMGGEPTLHPDFEKIVRYICGKRNSPNYTHSLKPIRDFNEHYKKHLIPVKGEFFDKGRAGLWSAMNRHYLRHFEIINDSFDCQVLNDHDNHCLHQAMLVSRKELGIPDDEWENKRDNCWIQNTWSATITPKGAFFCEIAGALDMLFDGPGGWKVEPGWWKRDVADYKDQLHWCELCGGCLNVPKRLSHDGRDDITPKMLKKLQKLESPKIKQGKYHLLDPENYKKDDYTPFVDSNDYMEENKSERIGEKSGLYEKNFTIYPLKSGISDYLHDKKLDWAIFTDDPAQGEKLGQELQNWVLNPGCLHRHEKSVIFNRCALSIRDEIDKKASMTLDDLIALYPNEKIIDITETIKLHVL